MKNISSWRKSIFITLLTLLVNAAVALLWAGFNHDLSSAAISRGFFVSGVLAILFGFGSLRTSYSFVDSSAPSYSTAYYKTLGGRVNLMMSDMAEHSSLAMILLGNGLFSLLIGFLIIRFG